MAKFLFPKTFLSKFFKFFQKNIMKKSLFKIPAFGPLTRYLRNTIITMDFLKIIDQATTCHRPPTKRPTDTKHQPTHYRPNAPTPDQVTSTSRKFVIQKYFEFIFDINYKLKCRVFKIFLSIIHTH